MLKTQIVTIDLTSPKYQDIIQYYPQIKKLTLINQVVYNQGLFLLKKHGFFYSQFDLLLNKEDKIQQLKAKIADVEYKIVELGITFFSDSSLAQKEKKELINKINSLVKTYQSSTYQLKKIQNFNLNKTQKRKLFGYLRQYVSLFSKKIPQDKINLFNQFQNNKQKLTKAKLTEIFSVLNKTLSYFELDKLYADHFPKKYRLKHLTSQSIQQTLKELCEAQTSFYLSLKAYQANPSLFKGKPQFPQYAYHEFGKPLTITNQESCISYLEEYVSQKDKEKEKLEKIIFNKNKVSEKYCLSQTKRKLKQVKRKQRKLKNKRKQNSEYDLISLLQPKAGKLKAILPEIYSYIEPSCFKEAKIQVKANQLIIRLVYEVKDNYDSSDLKSNLNPVLISELKSELKKYKNNKQTEFIAKVLDTFNQIKSGILAIDLGLTYLCTLFNSQSGETYLLKNRKLNKLIYRLFKLNDKFTSDKDAHLLAELKYTYFVQTGSSFNKLPKYKQNQLWKTYQKENAGLKTAKMIRNQSRIERLKKTILHKVSRFIVNYAKQHHLHTIVIGLNQGWKQGKNRKRLWGIARLFQQTGFTQLIEKIKYKAQCLNIKVETIGESYTSKVDHLAYEKLCHHNQYLGKRTNRDTFVSSTGLTLQADINGSIGICLKYLLNLRKELGLTKLISSKFSFARQDYKIGDKTEMFDTHQLHQVLSLHMVNVLKI